MIKFLVLTFIVGISVNAFAEDAVVTYSKGQSLVVCKDSLRELNTALASQKVSAVLNDTQFAEIDAPFTVSAPSVSQYIASTSGAHVQYGWEVCVTVTKQ